MNDIPTIIGNNLKKRRKQKMMTLENLSQETGVSISMLGEIERGVTNPTITILWKIADGLKISLSELIHEEEPSVSVTYLQNAALNSVGDRYKILTLFRFDPQKRFEVFCKILEAGSAFESEGHRKGVEEYLFISGNDLALQVGKAEYHLHNGDAIRFRADIYHRYHNPGNSAIHVFTVLYYGEE